MPEVFKKCSCGSSWETREKFLSDPAIKIHGYMVHFKELELGLFIFNHITPQCGTSLGIKAGEFTDLYKGEVFQERKTGTKECPQYCLHPEEMQKCAVKCECSYVREALDIVKAWPKSE